MKRKIVSQILLVCIYVGLVPIVAWGQVNDTSSTGSKLRIAIPVREFNEFVDIQHNPVTGENNYTGFAIEVFKEVVNYTFATPIPYEFVPFKKPDGTMNGSFDDMLQAVFNKDYDGAVGEISILYYRTQWVDFTMPYIEATITMLVPIKEQSYSGKAAGFSLIGITYASLITAFLIALVLLLAATFHACITFSRFFRKKDNMPRDKAWGSQIQTRLLMTTFFLILLTPNACYIITQASSSNSNSNSNSSSSRNRTPTINNLSELMKKGSNVGYREGSFISTLLRYKGFPDSKLISLKSEQDMAMMLAKGTAEGGVDAIVANAPQLKLLQAKYCDNFTMVSIPNLHVTGFGFAFRKNSSIVEDVSNGILKLIDGGRLGKIQDRTIGNLEVCPYKPNNDAALAPSSFISPDHQWILILAGLLIALLLIVSLVFLF